MFSLIGTQLLFCGQNDTACFAGVINCTNGEVLSVQFDLNLNLQTFSTQYFEKFQCGVAIFECLYSIAEPITLAHLRIGIFSTACLWITIFLYYLWIIHYSARLREMVLSFLLKYAKQTNARNFNVFDLSTFLEQL